MLASYPVLHRSYRLRVYIIYGGTCFWMSVGHVQQAYVEELIEVSNTSPNARIVSMVVSQESLALSLLR